MKKQDPYNVLHKHVKKQPDAGTTIEWIENGRRQSAPWRSEGRKNPPKRIIPVDDAIRADTAYRHACAGTGMLWRGDFQNAKQVLAAMARRADRKPKKPPNPPASKAEAFHRYRMAVSNRARILGMVLIELQGDGSIRLRRAPDTRQAVAEAHGTGEFPVIRPLREILGIIGAHQWRKKGIPTPFLGDRIHPHYGVFPPTRKEYITLVAQMPLSSVPLAVDIGTGTGVLAAVLAKRGVLRVIATDNDPRAIACARENMDRLGFSDRVEVISADLFPPQKAPLLVCNPPWIPTKPASTLEKGVYDPDNRMLHRFLHGLPHHLEPGGEAWLVLSDLAEHLGLRTREELLGAFETAGLDVLDKIDAPPLHPRAADKTDPLHAARAAERVSLWRLTLT